MPENDLEPALRAYRTLQQDGVDAFLAFFDPAAEWHSLVLELEGAFHGNEGVRQWLDGIQAIFPDWMPTATEFRAVGDCVVIHQDKDRFERWGTQAEIEVREE